MFILPISRDDNGPYVPPVVVALIAINTLVLFATYAFSSERAVFLHYGFVPAHPQAITLLTSMFIHAGLWHLAGNMFFLWMFGKRVERSWGSPLFALVYLASGIVGGLLHYASNSASAIPCGGASGAISGVVGCYFVLYPKANFDLHIYFGWFRIKTFPSHTTAAVGAWIGEQLLLGLLSQAVRFSSTAFWAHIGGFAAGAAAALVFRKCVPEEKDLGAQQYIPDYSTGTNPYDDNKLTLLNLKGDR